MAHKNNINKVKEDNPSDQLTNAHQVELLAAHRHHDQTAAIMDAVAILDQAHDAVITTDLHANITHCNKTAERLFAYSATELIGQPVYLLYPQDKQQFSTGDIIKILQGNEDFNIETVMRARSGEDVYVRNSFSLLFDADAEVAGIISYTLDITEQKISGLAIARSEEMLRRFYEAGLVGMGLSSPDKGLFHFNDRFCEIIGYTRDELATISWADITHPDDLEDDVVKFNQLLAGEIDGYSKDKRCFRKDGKIIHVSLSTKCTRKADGTVDYLVSFLEDISERVQALEALQLYEHIINASTDAMAIVDTDYTFLAVNQRYLDAFKKSRDDAIGHTMLEMIGEENFAKLAKPGVDKALTGVTVKHQSWSYQPGFGRRYLEVSDIPYRDADGAVIGVIISVHDITEQKIVEDALRESEEQLRCYYDAGLVGMSINRADRSWLQMNDAYCKIIGYTQEELQNIDWADITHPDDMEISSEYYKQLWAGEIDRCTFDKRYFRKDGEIVYVTLSTECIRKADGGVDYIISFVHDITEKKQAEEALKRSEQLSRSYFEAGLIGMSISSPERGLIQFNDTYCEITGYPRDELTKMTWLDISHPDDRAFEIELHNKVLAGEIDGYTKDKRCIRKDGKIAYVKVSSECIRKEDGTPDYFIVFAQDVSEQKMAEASLKRSEEQLRRYFDTELVGMSIATPDKNWQQVNDSYCKMLGYSREELEATSWSDITHPDDLPASIEQHNKIMAGEIDKYSLDKRYIRKDGEVVYVTLSVESVRNTANEIDYLIGFVQDITEQKQAEQSLRRNESLLKEAQHIAHLGFWEWNISDDNLFWSDETYELIGVDPASFKATYENFLALVHIDDQQYLRDSLQASAEEGAPYDINYRVVVPDGVIRHVHAQGETSYDDSGVPVRMFGTIIDVTKQKEAEEALRQSEEGLRLYFEAGLIGMMVTSPERMLLQVNDTFCEFIGYSREELETISWVDITHPDDLQESVEQYERVASGEIEGFTQDKRYVRKDGQIVFASLSYKAVRKEDETIAYFVAFVIDITERKLAEAELARYRKHLEVLVRERTSELEATQQELITKERLAVLGQLTATVSHELRNPLGTISSSLYSIAKKAADQGLILGPTMERAERNVVRCNNIIEELLDYTRIHKLEFEQAAIDEWLTKVLDEYQFPDGLAVTYELHAAATVEFEPERLHRCVINIINNACQAMKTNENEADIQSQRLKISSHISDGRFEIQVDDTGPGIAEDKLPDIFEPLYSTKIYGVGLGLSIVKHIMELHNGGIEISSKEGEGTSVKLWLPLQQQNGVKV